MICTEQTIGQYSQKKKKEKCKIKKDKKLLHPVLAQDNIDNVLSEIDLHSVVKHLKITLGNGLQYRSEKCKIKKNKKLLHPVLAQDNIDNVLSEIDLHSVVKHLKITLGNGLQY